jgi:hypothetical protein
MKQYQIIMSSEALNYTKMILKLRDAADKEELNKLMNATQALHNAMVIR